MYVDINLYIFKLVSYVEKFQEFLSCLAQEEL